MLCNGAIETAGKEAVPEDSETLAKTDHPRFRLFATKTHQFAVSGCLRTAISRTCGCTPGCRKSVLRVAQVNSHRSTRYEADEAWVPSGCRSSAYATC